MTFLLDRRRLLIGLAAASTAAAAPVVASASAPAENPELLRLADQLDAAVAEVAAARAHKRAVINEWWWEWPSAPAAICDGHAIHYNYNGPGERGLTNTAILANGHSVQYDEQSRVTGPEWLAIVAKRRADPDAYYARCVGTSKDFAASRDRLMKAISRKRPRHPLDPVEIVRLEMEAGLADDKAALAAEYEAECERVRKASGYGEAVARDKAAFDALAALVGAIIATRAETMAGVIAKAQALAAWEAEPLHVAHVQSWGWSGAFAAEVIRLANQSA